MASKLELLNNQLIQNKEEKEDILDLLNIDIDNLKHEQVILVKLPFKLKRHLNEMARDHGAFVARKRQRADDGYEAEHQIDEQGNFIDESLKKQMQSKDQ